MKDDFRLSQLEKCCWELDCICASAAEQLSKGEELLHRGACGNQAFRKWSLTACSSSPCAGPETVDLIYRHAQHSQLQMKLEHMKYSACAGCFGRRAPLHLGLDTHISGNWSWLNLAVPQSLIYKLWIIPHTWLWLTAKSYLSNVSVGEIRNIHSVLIRCK